MSDPFAIRDPGEPSKWPVGSRVVIPEFEDSHFFRRGSTGTVARYRTSRYLGVIVRLDQPIQCDHGHYRHLIEEFNFNAADLREEPPIDEQVETIERVLQPRGRCQVCGGGEFYWKHMSDSDEYHAFIPPASPEPTPGLREAIEALPSPAEGWPSGYYTADMISRRDVLAALDASPTYTEVERLDRPGNRADGVRAAGS